MEWFRFYAETIHDRKLRRLNPAQRWLWVTLLSLACSSPSRGKLLLSEGVPVTVEDLVDAAAIPLKDVQSGLETFEKQKMIHTENDVIVINKWDQRQFTSDRSNERVKKHREQSNRNVTLHETLHESLSNDTVTLHESLSNDTVTLHESLSNDTVTLHESLSNDTVTLHESLSNDTVTLHESLSNDTVTPPDTETETDLKTCLLLARARDGNPPDMLNANLHDLSIYTIAQLYERYFGRLVNPILLEKIAAFMDQDAMEIGLIELAFQITREGAKDIKYATGILQNWAQKGIKTTFQAQEEQKRREEWKHAKNQRVHAGNPNENREIESRFAYLTGN